MDYRLVSFRPGLEDDFFRLHCPANDAGWCNCVAWLVDGWEGWGERTAEQNRQLHLWNGPESVFAAAGFEFVKEVAQRAVLRLVI